MQIGQGNGKKSYQCTKKGNLSIIYTLFYLNSENINYILKSKVNLYYPLTYLWIYTWETFFNQVIKVNIAKNGPSTRLQIYCGAMNLASVVWHSCPSWHNLYLLMRKYPTNLVWGKVYKLTEIPTKKLTYTLQNVPIMNSKDEGTAPDWRWLRNTTQHLSFSLPKNDIIETIGKIWRGSMDRSFLIVMAY